MLKTDVIKSSDSRRTIINLPHSCFSLLFWVLLFSQMRICAFEHCSNSTYQLQKWKINKCGVHKGVKHKGCVCKPPFVIFPFPTNLSDAETTRDWIRAVNRKNF